MSDGNRIEGTCDPRFEAVREAFEHNFAERDELGAACCVLLDGEPVVDLWAGDADPRGTPWERDTIINVYSTTKTMATICLLMLVDRGQLDLDAPVARYWPEFAQAGKAGVTVDPGAVIGPRAEIGAGMQRAAIVPHQHVVRFPFVPVHVFRLGGEGRQFLDQPARGTRLHALDGVVVDRADVQALAAGDGMAPHHGMPHRRHRRLLLLGRRT